MKSFNDFKKYVSENGDKIHSSINQAVLGAMDKQNFEDVGEENEFYRRAWVEVGIIKVLEQYHNWINS